MQDQLKHLAPWLPAWPPTSEAWLSLAVFAGLLLLASLLVVLLASARRRAVRKAAERATLEARLLEAARASEAQLGELKGRLAAMAEMTSSRQAELAQGLDRRLDGLAERLGAGLQGMGLKLGESLEGVTQRLAGNLAETGTRLGSSLGESQERTAESLARLYERLALLDQAQARLGELTSQVTSLKEVLANKQARGAFGQARMEAIIEDGLPRGAYQFQATLSNGKRPDCLVRLPAQPVPLVIDAKFPLEGFEALRQAQSSEAATAAAALVREAVGRHIEDIAGKYLIPGETQDTALLFIPSEAVTVELHERFPDLVQRAHRSRIVIVSPSMLMLAVQTMQAILKDVRMREQAGLVQREVGLLMGDVGRLAERVRELEKHFTLAARDVERILTATDRLSQRGRRIETVDLGDGETPAEPPRQIAGGG